MSNEENTEEVGEEEGTRVHYEDIVLTPRASRSGRRDTHGDLLEQGRRASMFTRLAATPLSAIKSAAGYATSSVARPFNHLLYGIDDEGSVGQDNRSMEFVPENEEEDEPEDETPDGESNGEDRGNEPPGEDPLRPEPPAPSPPKRNKKSKPHVITKTRVLIDEIGRAHV